MKLEKKFVTFWYVQKKIPVSLVAFISTLIPEIVIDIVGTYKLLKSNADIGKKAQQAECPVQMLCLFVGSFSINREAQATRLGNASHPCG